MKCSSRVGNLEGTWQIEMKIPQRNIGQIMRAFEDNKLHKADAIGRKYLDVDVLLSSMPDTRYLGRLYQEELSAEAVPNKNDQNEEARTGRDCVHQAEFGRHSAGEAGAGVAVRVRAGSPHAGPLRRSRARLLALPRCLGVVLREGRVLLLIVGPDAQARKNRLAASG